MVLLGKPAAENIYLQIKKGLQLLRDKNIMPTLGVILVGEDPPSLSYIKIKEKIAKNLGIDFQLFHLSGIVSEKEVENLISKLNLDKCIDGIVVQLPLPADFHTEKILKEIKPEKDVDGFYSSFSAPTPQAILEILNYYQIEIKNKNIVIVGHGRLVGGPLDQALQKQNIKATICDLKTPDLSEKTLSADILITAVGVSGLIKPAMVKSETIIIDAGTSEVGGKIVGDVSPEVYQKVSTYTPNPGGVGPVTVACLMRNVVDASKK